MGLVEDLNTSSQSEGEMEGGLLLDVVIRESAAIFELLTSEDKSLLIRRDSNPVLDLRLDVFNVVRCQNLNGDGLSCDCFDEDLEGLLTSYQSEDKMEGGLLLDVVIRESVAISELLTSEDKSLLIRKHPNPVLDLGFNVLNVVGWSNIKCDSAACPSLHENLHVSIFLIIIILAS